MKTVYKYQLGLVDVQMVKLPKDAEILSVQVQQGSGPCLWALVDPSQEVEEVKIRIAGTGHPICENIVKHIGTFQMQNGALVFHTFVVK